MKRLKYANGSKLVKFQDPGPQVQYIWIRNTEKSEGYCLLVRIGPGCQLKPSFD